MKLLLLLLLSFARTNGGISQVISYSGIAYSLNDHKDLYREDHEEFYENGKHIKSITVYKNTTGSTIARREILFGEDASRPTFRFEDLRTGFVEGAENKGPETRIYYRENKNAAWQEKTFTIPGLAVVDGGFNYFIKQHWPELISGKRLVFNIAVPERLDYYSFRIAVTQRKTVNGKACITMKMEPDNFFLRALLASIDIDYDLESKRIVEYKGISNIQSPDGKRYFTRLVYPQLGP